MTDATTRTGNLKAPLGPAAEERFWKLRVVYEPSAGIVQTDARVLRENKPLTLGRESSSAKSGRQLLLADSMVSREHARVALSGDSAQIEDLGSKNGTSVNGCLLQQSQGYPLHDGDVLRVGDSLLMVRHEPLSVEDANIPALVGLSHAACRLRSTVARAAPSDCPVLLLGETGTGKGAAATAVHVESKRIGELVEVNCAAIPANLAEGMFFGVKKGAYTGATEQAGFFGRAHRGTLFLDEIGELPAELQPKLLQAIQTHRVTPLGHDKPTACDVRIIAATNRDLSPALRDFREDLYHRLAGIVIQLPTLRERREDILLLAAHLAGRAFHPSPAFATALLYHQFPGNVREVGNLMCRISTLGEADVIASIAQPLIKAGGSLPAAPVGIVRAAVWTPDKPPSREQLVAYLSRYRGNLSQIEAATGCSRRQLGRWVQAYNLDLQSYRGLHPVR